MRILIPRLSKLLRLVSAHIMDAVIPEVVMHDAVIESPLGRLGIRISTDRLISIDFLPPREPLKSPEHAVAAEAARQLGEFFAGRKTRFNVPVKPAGTKFQRRVWRALQSIPAGQIRTYGELAGQVGSSPRAVGGACRANPIPILIPCHRIVSATGIGGYSGATSGARLAIKDWLLRHEGVAIDRD